MKKEVKSRLVETGYRKQQDLQRHNLSLLCQQELNTKMKTKRLSSPSRVSANLKKECFPKVGRAFVKSADWRSLFAYRKSLLRLVFKYPRYLNKLSQNCSWRAPVLLHATLYKAVKLRIVSDQQQSVGALTPVEAS